MQKDTTKNRLKEGEGAMSHARRRGCSHSNRAPTLGCQPAGEVAPFAHVSDWATLDFGGKPRSNIESARLIQIRLAFPSPTGAPMTRRRNKATSTPLAGKPFALAQRKAVFRTPMPRNRSSCNADSRLPFVVPARRADRRASCRQVLNLLLVPRACCADRRASRRQVLNLFLVPRACRADRRA